MILKKITPQEINDLIYSVKYEVVDATTTTICIIMTKCGFTAIGTNSCLNMSDWIEQKGKEDSYAKAIDKIWEMEGYHRKRMAEHNRNS